MAAATLACVLPWKALRPVIISCRSAPKAKMSLRASTSPPSSTSGAMYWNVPITVPVAVKGLAAVAAIVIV